MKRINRAILRGEKLDDDCKKAKTLTNECGPHDNRCFCSGIIDCSTESYLEQYINCGAFIGNAKPIGVE